MGALEITQEMKDKKQQKLKEIYDRQNRSIKRAMERGDSSACFVLDPWQTYYDEVRREYESKGYRIKPTGYIGGVWQLSEDICW